MSADLNNCRVSRFVLKPSWRPGFRPLAFESVNARYELAETYFDSERRVDDRGAYLSISLRHEYRLIDA